MTTRLNRHIRSAIVRAAMDDIPPKRDFDAEAEAIVQEAATAALPAEIAAIYRNPELRHYLETEYVHFASDEPRYRDRVSYEGQHVAPPQWEVPKDVAARVLDLMRENDKEDARRDAVRAALRDAVTSVQTVEKLIGKFPDLERYVRSLVHLPTENLPAIVAEDPIAKLRAAGWPH